MLRPLVAAALLVSVADGWQPAARGCPSVYIYDLPELWDFHIPLGDLKESSAKSVFGRPCDAGLDDEYDTDQYAMPLIVLWRLLRSRRCPRAADPAEADLFLVPTWPGRSKRPWHPACTQEANAFAMARLTHLSEATAHRHFFLVGKGHVKPNKRCDSWWRAPAGLLRRAMRFAYSPEYYMVPGKNRTGYGPKRLDDDALADAMAVDPADDANDYPHLYSVPYASSIHRAPPWAVATTPAWFRDDDGHADHLAAYLGTPHADMPFAAARRRLADECARAPLRLCSGMDVHDVKRANAHHFCGLNTSTKRATFCLEPGGDSPYRKGFYDAMLTGCIPVVFSLYNARVAPWFVPKDAVVVLNETAYLDGDFHALDKLAAIPAADVRRMQATLAHHAHKLQYAVDDVHDDAFETLLKGALKVARSRHAALFPGGHDDARGEQPDSEEQPG